MGIVKVENDGILEAHVVPETLCPRCGAVMQFVKACYHCLVCQYKEGCCEGAPQS